MLKTFHKYCYIIHIVVCQIWTEQMLYIYYLFHKIEKSVDPI